MWSTNAATFTPVNVINGTPQTWNYSLTAPYSVDNASYSLVATPFNSVGIAGTPAAITFIYDKTTPTLGLASPSGIGCAGVNTCLSSLGLISGTATDPGNVNPPSIPYASLKLRIKNNVNNNYWNGTSFQAGSVDLLTSAAGFSSAGNSVKLVCNGVKTPADVDAQTATFIQTYFTAVATPLSCTVQVTSNAMSSGVSPTVSVPAGL